MPSIGWEIHLASISCNFVASETFFAIQPELSCSFKDKDLIVERLGNEIFPAWVHCYAWHAVWKYDGEGCGKRCLCMFGSATSLIETGIPKSQTLKTIRNEWNGRVKNLSDLSSEVETNRLLLSTKVTVFTAPRCDE